MNEIDRKKQKKKGRNNQDPPRSRTARNTEHVERTKIKQTIHQKGLDVAKNEAARWSVKKKQRVLQIQRRKTKID